MPRKYKHVKTIETAVFEMKKEGKTNIEASSTHKFALGRVATI